MKEDSTNPNCYWYTHGGDIERGFTCYPPEYGARCELFKRFFQRNKLGRLDPNCPSCTARAKTPGEKEDAT